MTVRFLGEPLRRLAIHQRGPKMLLLLATPPLSLDHMQAPAQLHARRSRSCKREVPAGTPKAAPLLEAALTLAKIVLLRRVEISKGTSCGSLGFICVGAVPLQRQKQQKQLKTSDPSTNHPDHAHLVLG